MSSNPLHEAINQLLSDYHIYYQNTRGFHWNIKGKRFFELHVKFEELYTEALTTIDALAERLLSVGGQPLHTFTDYLAKSNITEHKDLSEDTPIVKAIIDQLKTLIAQENVVKELAASSGDSETEDMMIGLISEQEKTIWMFTSWLG